MFIKFANSNDAQVVHEVMIRAFTKYKKNEFPSTALEETVESIHNAMKRREQAFICYNDKLPVAVVRFHVEQDSLHFYRLSVIPTEQGKGIAKRIIAHLESYAKDRGVRIIKCKVRQSEMNNINLYCSVGYTIFETKTLDRQEGKMEIVLMEKRI